MKYNFVYFLGISKSFLDLRLMEYCYLCFWSAVFCLRCNEILTCLLQQVIFCSTSNEILFFCVSERLAFFYKKNRDIFVFLPPPTVSMNRPELYYFLRKRQLVQPLRAISARRLMKYCYFCFGLFFCSTSNGILLFFLLVRLQNRHVCSTSNEILLLLLSARVQNRLKSNISSGKVYF